MKMRLVAAALLTLGLSAAPSAGVISVDISSLPSGDLRGAAGNTLVTFDLGAALGAAGSDVILERVGWDLLIDTVGDSWRSEAVIGLQSPAGNTFLEITAALGDDSPGSTHYTSPLIDLAQPGVLGYEPRIVGGILTLELYESFDDFAGGADAFYGADSFVLFGFSLATAASEPGILMLFGFGLAGVAMARRRLGQRQIAQT